MNAHTDYLALSWTTSRGRDTYGYNVCRLDVRSTGQRFKCMGGGYDMTGTVVGEWLQATYQPRLQALNLEALKLYGARRLHFNHKPGHVSLDGACGLESMQRIAEALGIYMSRTYVTKGRNRGQTTGWMVTDYGSAAALLANRAP